MKERHSICDDVFIGMDLAAGGPVMFRTFVSKQFGPAIQISKEDTLDEALKSAEEFLAGQFKEVRAKLQGIPGCALEETWIDRLKAEKDELGEKVEKLDQFLTTNSETETIGATDRQLLTEQLRLMSDYYLILEKRLERAQA